MSTRRLSVPVRVPVTVYGGDGMLGAWDSAKAADLAFLARTCVPSTDRTPDACPHCRWCWGMHA